ncbi:excalibur calcium-binding domain-containing protein [Psychrobacter sp. 28M-43]|nr:excalibur calcium-binding domain-containing protein [Psychrobacter sp. 28M-43]
MLTQPTLTSTDVDNIDDIAPTYVDLGTTSTSVPTVTPALSTQPASSFSCDGRTHCSQMTSCAEATYFTNYCPNTKMDGNHDGVPCEQQWCN